MVRRRPQVGDQLQRRQDPTELIGVLGVGAGEFADVDRLAGLEPSQIVLDQFRDGILARIPSRIWLLSNPSEPSLA